MDLKFDIFTNSSYQTFITGRPYTERKSDPECCCTSTASQILQPLGQLGDNRLGELDWIFLISLHWKSGHGKTDSNFTNTVV